jgi:tRNA U34 5-methylaminomethyl-2-thiouridine-forming methyltransferase MnmC
MALEEKINGPNRYVLNKEYFCTKLTCATFNIFHLNQLIKTTDGSHTIYVPELDEHYHSIHGAVQESTFIFINNGFRVTVANPLNILEVGFGTGLNAFLTAMECSASQRVVNYTTLEKYPLSKELTGSLNYPDFSGEEGPGVFERIHSAPWNTWVKICGNFNLKKVETDLTQDQLDGEFDLIYFDAFGPDKQPGMWTREIFAKIALVTGKGGILVTYSAKGEVKRTLRACGFEVELLPGPPGKRQMIRAVKI